MDLHRDLHLLLQVTDHIRLLSFQIHLHDKNLSGLVLIPLVGSRGCLIVGSFLLVLANLLTYCSLDWGVEFVVATYGLLGGVSVALTMVATSTSSNEKQLL